MAITYTRTFAHREWIDNVDRVQAGGDNGFNGRFHALESEFDALSGVFEQIAQAIAVLSATPPAQEVRAAFTPTLVATSGSPWGHGVGFAQKPPGATAAHGMMSIGLPHGARIRQLRASGQNSGAGSLRILLLRQSATDPAATSDQIARVDGQDNPFSGIAAANQQFERVDNAQFKYYVSVRLDNAQAADTVNLVSFQVVYLTS
jgi:hypothetical protein